MPKTEPITSVCAIVNDRENCYGEDPEFSILCHMAATQYGMVKLFPLCGPKCCYIAENAAQEVAKALIWLYKRHGLVLYFDDKQTAKSLIINGPFMRIKDEKLKEAAEECLQDLIEEVENNFHLYGNKQSVDAHVIMGADLFKHRLATDCFNRMKSADETTDTVPQFLEAFDKAVQDYTAYKVELSTDATNLLDCDADFDKAFEQAQNPVFALPSRYGAFATMLNSQLLPESFIAFLAPEKRGKSWLLQEIAIQAARSGADTLMVQCGDMSKADVKLRVAVRLLKRGYKERYCGELYIPTLDCVHNQNNSCHKERRAGTCGIEIPESEPDEERAGKGKKQKKKQVDNDPSELLAENPEYLPCAECARCEDRAWQPAYWWTKRNPVMPITIAEAKQAFAKAQQQWRGKLWIEERSSNTLTITELESMIRGMEQTGKKIRVLVLDYMDLMASEKGNSKDYRQFQNELWKGMRGLLQEFKLVGIVATQANIGGQDAEYLDMHNISEDKRKGSHITAMWGLNQTPQEKRMGIMRMNCFLDRHNEFDPREQFVLLQSLQTGQPILGSYVVKNYSS